MHMKAEAYSALGYADVRATAKLTWLAGGSLRRPHAWTRQKKKEGLKKRDQWRCRFFIVKKGKEKTENILDRRKHRKTWDARYCRSPDSHCIGHSRSAPALNRFLLLVWPKDSPPFQADSVKRAATANELQ